MKILVVGKGGREHALAWKLAQSKGVEKIYCAPGNAGISKLAEIVPIGLTDLVRLADFAQEKKIDLTVVGPELPLTLGIVDVFEERGLRIFGPTKEASEIEGSKAFAKDFMQRYHIPTASFRIFSDPAEAVDFISRASYPLVVKADGLAAGKGTVIVNTPSEAQATIENIMVKKVFGQAGERLLVEEFLEGEEVTVMALTDGERVIPMVSSQDHKRIFDGNTGPNTGGMGAYAPTNVIPDKMMKRIVDEVLDPTISGLAEMGRMYKGVLYTGIIVTDRGPKVLEYNCRFGDPETQAVLPLLETDLVEIFLDIADGYLNINEIKWKDKSCVCVVVASRGYPESEEKDKVIEGLDRCDEIGCMVFHAGTAIKYGKCVTNGGRILGVTAADHSLRAAIAKVYECIQGINFDGMQYRRDIGMRAVKVDSSYF
ncbi:MAG: phosphoribosylamine--glycine ligase [candidate division Zixibacteria bacterium RBG_16_53_22]|nr:MAG: phosphoribosylamine--glycine ligase [candidate division Zixibacteria bacterium RBG_16_53_22]